MLCISSITHRHAILIYTNNISRNVTVAVEEQHLWHMTGAPCTGSQFIDNPSNSLLLFYLALVCLFVHEHSVNRWCWICRHFPCRPSPQCLLGHWCFALFPVHVPVGRQRLQRDVSPDTPRSWPHWGVFPHADSLLCSYSQRLGWRLWTKNGAVPSVLWPVCALSVTSLSCNRLTAQCNSASALHLCPVHSWKEP